LFEAANPFTLLTIIISEINSPAGGRYIKFISILCHHAVCIKDRGDGPDTMFHHSDPFLGQPGSPTVIHWDQLFLQGNKKRNAVLLILGFFILVIAFRPNDKAVVAIVSFRPPAVQSADINKTV
jgi:hypothetical protein